METLRSELLRIRIAHDLKLKLPPFRRIVNRQEAQYSAATLLDAEFGLRLRELFLENLAGLPPLYRPSTIQSCGLHTRYSP